MSLCFLHGVTVTFDPSEKYHRRNVLVGVDDTNNNTPPRSKSLDKSSSIADDNRRNPSQHQIRARSIHCPKKHNSSITVATTINK